MTDYPTMIATVNHMEPVPRRIRATVGARTILDTTHAVYLWEWPNYPQYYIPLADIDPTVLVDEQPTKAQSRHREAAQYSCRRRAAPRRRPGVRR